MNREKYKEAVLLLISVNTDDELREMVKESCWNHYTVEIMLEELENRKKMAAMFLPGRVTGGAHE